MSYRSQDMPSGYSTVVLPVTDTARLRTEKAIIDVFLVLSCLVAPLVTWKFTPYCLVFCGCVQVERIEADVASK